MKRVKKLVVSITVAVIMLLVTSGIVFAADAGTVQNKTSLSSMSKSTVTTFKVKPNNGIKNGKVRVIYGTINELVSAGQTRTYQIQYDNNGDVIDEVAFEGAGDEGYAFYSWSYTPNHVYNDNPNGHRTRTISTNKVSTFTPNPKFKKVYTLDINIDPIDGGTVTKSPDSSYYFEGDTVTLTANASNTSSNKYTFTGWSGNASGSLLTTTVTMDSNKSVTASFRPRVSPILEYTLDNGDGTYTAHFGYLVRGSTNVSFPVGGSNKFNYQGNGGLDFGQPTTFDAGRHYDVFSIDFNGSNLVWTLDGSTATASAGNVKYLLNVSANPSGGGVVTISPDKSYYSPGETVTLTAIPTDNDSEKYVFSGWLGDASGNSLTTTITMNRTKAVTASFGVKQYGVVFRDEDGSQISSQTVPFGASAVRPDDPQKEGYTFSGWSLSGDNDSYSDSLDTVKENLVATATYDINNYTVTFVDHDGSELGIDTVDWNTGAAAPASPSREGYTFTGWDKDFSAVKNNMTVTATYAINTFTVTFVDHDGTVLDTNTVDWNTAAEAPTNPSREGYTFAGWNSDFSAVQNDITVTATYTINTYTVTFVDYDGTILGIDVVNWNTSATAPVSPSREGYTFAGWSSDFSAVQNNITVEATYTINTFTVSFADYDGTVLGTDSVSWNTGATAPANPARAGYTFTGWDVDFSTVTTDMTATAMYTINTYTVTFEDQNGTVLGTDRVRWNSAATAPEAPQRTGFTFTGWDTDYDPVRANITVTATYEPIMLNVMASIVGDGEFNDTITGTYAYGTEIDLNAVAVTPAEGFEFSGWQDQNGNTVNTVTLTADTELTAVFTALTATIVDEEVPNANGNEQGATDVETIATEDVPLAKPETGSALWWLLVLLPLGVLIWFLIAWKNNVIPVAESVSDNGDGTYTVVWGYENKKSRKIAIDRSKSTISALSGKIVGGTGRAPHEFEKGEAHSVFTTVAENGSKLQWQIRSKKTTVSDK